MNIEENKLDETNFNKSDLEYIEKMRYKYLEVL